jgi:tetratricopeptide (TPR) repeat protein
MNKFRQFIPAHVSAHVRAYVRAYVRAHGAAVGICAAVAVVALVSHAVVLGNDFINYDDPGYVTQNAQVQAGLTAGGIKSAFTGVFLNNWTPLVNLVYMLDHDLFGMNPAGYHAVNLLIHAANAALLFIVMFRMTGELWPSALTGALFAAHPASVESVAWVSELKDVLSTLFWLLTMYFYAGYAKADGSREGKSRALKNYVLMTAAFTLGLMSKQMLVTLPFALLLLDWWPLKRFGSDGCDTAMQGKGSGISGLLIEKIPLIILSALFILVVLHAQEKSMVTASISLNQRVANALLSYVVYIGKLIWPMNLCVFYPIFIVSPAKALASALGLSAATAAVLYYAKRLRWLPVGWFWYLGTLVPVIGLVQVGIQASADRYLYVPRIGLFITAAWGLYRFAAKYNVKKHATVFAVLIVIIFSALTHAQAERWKNNKTLYEHCLAVTENNFVVLGNLGNHYYDNEGDPDKAAEYYKKAIELHPSFTPCRMGLGKILKARGDVAGALAQYETALKFAPHDAGIHNDIAGIYAAEGRFGPALEHYLMAVNDNPDSAEINYYIADTLVRLGRAQEALKYYRRALDIWPDLAEAHNNLGYVLTEMGKTDEAEAHLRRAVEINPGFAQAHYTLGLILLNRMNPSEAEAHLQKAVEASADFAAAHNALGVALEQLGRNDEAVLHFRRAVEINPGFAEARNNLAAVSQKTQAK